MREFDAFAGPAAVAIIKHTNPCGTATGTTVLDAYQKALEADPVSAFGGVIGINREVDGAAAEEGQALGLSHYLVEPGTGLAKGLELAGKIAANAPLTNFAVMHALPRIAESDPASGYLTGALMAAIAQGSDEAKSRLKDFLEKRGKKVVRG